MTRHLSLRACPRCTGDLLDVNDIDREPERQCLQCGARVYPTPAQPLIPRKRGGRAPRILGRSVA